MKEIQNQVKQKPQMKIKPIKINLTTIAYIPIHTIARCLINFFLLKEQSSYNKCDPNLFAMANFTV